MLHRGPELRVVGPNLRAKLSQRRRIDERLQLVFDGECSSCSSLAQWMKARRPGLAVHSIHSPHAHLVLRRLFPEGWRFRPYLIHGTPGDETAIYGLRLMLVAARMFGPRGVVKATGAWFQKRRRNRQRPPWMTDAAQRLRAYVAESIAAAEEFAADRLVMPPGLALERIVQFYNMRGAVQTASYWAVAGGASVIVEQTHVALPLPAASGGAVAEPVSIGDGLVASYYGPPEAAGEPAGHMLIIPARDGGWLAIRGNRLARADFLVVASSLDLHAWWKTSGAAARAPHPSPRETDRPQGE
jgi:hypothetical protein